MDCRIKNPRTRAWIFWIILIIRFKSYNFFEYLWLIKNRPKQRSPLNFSAASNTLTGPFTKATILSVMKRNKNQAQENSNFPSENLMKAHFLTIDLKVEELTATLPEPNIKESGRTASLKERLFVYLGHLRVLRWLIVWRWVASTRNAWRRLLYSH